MPTPKHTRGPWTVLWSSNKYPSIHAGPTQTPVAVLYEYVSETDRDLLDNAKANAHLIAAAPDLLEALEELISLAEQLEFSTDDDGIEFKQIKLARQALNKARGGT